MDLVDKIINISKEIRFKSNIYKLIKDTQDIDRTVIFTELESMEDFILFKEWLLKYGYLTNIDVRMINRIKEINSYPLYMVIDKHIENKMDKEKPLSLMVSLYDKEFLKSYSSSYDVDIININEVFNSWI